MTHIMFKQFLLSLVETFLWHCNEHLKILQNPPPFSPVRFSCPMACLIDLCFALEFSFKTSNLQIISDCRCWKVTIPYCQQCTKAEHVLHIRGTKRLATALLEICPPGGFSKPRTGGWWLVLRWLSQATQVLVQWWVLLEMPEGGLSLEEHWAAALHALPWKVFPPLTVLRLHYPENILIYMCTIWVEWLETAKRALGAGSLERSVQAVAGKVGPGLPLLRWARCPPGSRAGRVRAAGKR